MQKIKEVYFYSNHGKCYIKSWLKELDSQTRARILSRITRLEYGAYGDFKHIEHRIFELRFFFGKGYRMYYIDEGDKIILLLNAGSKDSQDKDIKLARNLLNEYLSRRNSNGKI